MRPLTVSLIQTETCWHDPAASRARFDRWFEEIPEAAELVVLPERFSTGFTMASADVVEPMDGPTVSWMRNRAAALGRTRTNSNYWIQRQTRGAAE